MEPLQYDWSWDDLSPEEGIVIKKCTVYGADLAYRSPQFPEWIHIVKGGKTITVLNGYDPKGKAGLSMLDDGPEWDDGYHELWFDDLIGWDFEKMLKKYDGVFVDIAAIEERHENWDGEGKLDVSDLVKPFDYFLDDDE